MNTRIIIENSKSYAKIGLVTFHDFNYGSALQCFATQKYLGLKGFDCEIIERKPPRVRILGYISTAWSLFSLCLLNPKSFRIILSIFTSERRGALRITDKSESLITGFNDSFLNVVNYSYSKLKREARKKHFLLFLSGSDQVWKANRINLYNHYFLRFAPKYKRVSWAASFGGGVIAPYNKKRYAKFIKEYYAISVREPSAVKMVKQLSNRDATCLADPVILHNKDMWRELYKKNANTLNQGNKYILYFFLDHPSVLAIDSTMQLAQQTGYRVVSFGYMQKNIENHIDGGPWEFLSMIDGAEYVMTDSFHTTVFALLFHKNFYVFDRQYVHKQSQSSRITDLLALLNLSDRYNTIHIDNNNINYSLVDEVLSTYRQEYDNFCKQIFRNII